MGDLENAEKFSILNQQSVGVQNIGHHNSNTQNYVTNIQIKVYMSDSRVQTLEGAGGDPHLLQAEQFFKQGTIQKSGLTQVGATADILAPALPEHLTPDGPSAVRADGRTAAPAPMRRNPSTFLQDSFKSSPIQASASDLERLTNKFPQLVDLLQQLDQQFHGKVQKMSIDDEALNVVDLLIQRGNLALWRFRQISARLFGQQVTATFRAQLEWPVPPQVEVFNAQAYNNIEILRGLFLSNLFMSQRYELIASAIDQLGQGHWRQVLNDWESRKILDSELIQQTRAQIEAIGQPYDPQEVRAAVRDAEEAFQSALQRQPGNTTALVSLATLEAESAAFFYIETGVADRATMKSARELFEQGRTLLSQKQDRASQIALGKCLLYIAFSLPSDASLESIYWARLQAQLMRASFSRQGQLGIRWDVAQRNFARRDPQFCDENVVKQAHSLFTMTGEIALIDQCNQMLQELTHARNMMQWTIKQLEMARPVIGIWVYTGGNMFVHSSGRIVFDAQGFFHWLADAQSAVMGQQQRSICIGEYQVMGNTIILGGMRWNMQPQFLGSPMYSTAMPFYFKTQIVIQGHMGNQLSLFSPEDGTLVQGQRL